MSAGAQMDKNLTRRVLLRGAAVGGTGIAAASLLPVQSAVAAETRGGVAFPGVDVVIDASHATTAAAVLVRDYLAAKSAHDPDATMAYFAHEPLTYIDAVLGWSWYTWDALLAALRSFMPNWPQGAESYPTRVLGDTTGAVVFFTDMPGMFGPSEIRAVGVVDFEDRKVARQIDYWDGRHFGIAGTASLRVSSAEFPTDFRESTVGEHAAPTMRRVARDLALALRKRDGDGAAALFAQGAVFEDIPAHLEIVGPRSIGAYLGAAASLLPYTGEGTAVRHVVGSAVGGGYEWTAIGGAVPRGVTALELDRWGKITRMTAMWDGSLVDDATLTALTQGAIEH